MTPPILMRRDPGSRSRAVFVRNGTAGSVSPAPQVLGPRHRTLLRRLSGSGLGPGVRYWEGSPQSRTLRGVRCHLTEDLCGQLTGRETARLGSKWTPGACMTFLQSPQRSDRSRGASGSRGLHRVDVRDDHAVSRGMLSRHVPSSPSTRSRSPSWSPYLPQSVPSGSELA